MSCVPARRSRAGAGPSARIAPARSPSCTICRCSSAAAGRRRIRRPPMANELGLRNVAFEVTDLQAAVDWAADRRLLPHRRARPGHGDRTRTVAAARVHHRSPTHARNHRLTRRDIRRIASRSRQAEHTPISVRRFPDQPLDQRDRVAQPLVVAGLPRQIRERTGQMPGHEPQPPGLRAHSEQHLGHPTSAVRDPRGESDLGRRSARDLLDEPGVAVRIGELGVRAEVGSVRIDAGRPAVRAGQLGV